MSMYGLRTNGSKSMPFGIAARKGGACKKCSNNLHEETTKYLTIYFYIKNITNFVCLNENGRKFATKAELKRIE